MMEDCMTQEDAMNMDNEQAKQILIPLRDMLLDQHGCPVSSAYFAIDKAISALSAKQQRGASRWIKHHLNKGPIPWGYDCGACGAWFVIGRESIAEYHYCPNCGATMEGVDE